MPAESDSVTKDVNQVWISPDGAVLTVLNGSSRGTTVPIPGAIGAEIVVGKAKEADLHLPDATVSRRHVSITRAERGLIVRDLDSRNGVRIGGALVKEAMVEPGTIISVGDIELLVKVEMRGALVPASESERFHAVVGRSIVMRRIFGLLERMAPTEAPVLLLGETGTGKDLLARAIHLASARASGPFEVVDCAAIAPTLIESELFGHEKGAFTGADRLHEGAFERARGGTLFLDELGELPLTLQPKLLRVLEAKEIRRLGGTKSIKTDVRIIAATTRNLAQEVEDGTFRQDLYFRLAVVPVYLPSLRNRLEDVPLIADALLKNVRPDVRLGPGAIATLKSYDWPGNVRELRNVLERAVYLVQSTGNTTIDELDLGTGQVSRDEDVYKFEPTMTYQHARGRADAYFELKFVTWLLGRHDGNITHAARAAKMDRKYLGDLVRKHKISSS